MGSMICEHFSCNVYRLLKTRSGLPAKTKEGWPICLSGTRSFNSLRTEIPKETGEPGTIPEGDDQNFYFYHQEDNMNRVRSKKFGKFLNSL